jgi:aspartate aminotransferase-like enzyme
MKAYENLQLFTPGPVSVPHRVLAAGSTPMLHHRSDEFSAILESMVEKAKWLISTTGDVLPVHTTGRGAMEGSISNLFSPGDTILSITNGRFGEMFADIAEKYGLKVHRICSDWLVDLEYGQLEEAFIKYPEAKAVTVCQCDTATGILNDLKEIARIAKKYGRMTVADCISSAGCVPIEFDEWQLDVVITASQKGLMSPTGLSFVALSQAAWDSVDNAKISKYYIDFRDIQRNLHHKHVETPGSTPVSLVCGVSEALSIIYEEGKENTYKRHETIARAIRAGLTAMNLQLFPAGLKNRSASLTPFLAPEGLPPSTIRRELKSKYGIVIAEGIGKEFKEKVLRIGHMGNIYPKDAIMIISCLESVLYEQGVLKNLGEALGACSKVLQKK